MFCLHNSLVRKIATLYRPRYPDFPDLQIVATIFLALFGPYALSYHNGLIYIEHKKCNQAILAWFDFIETLPTLRN
jgi:hypothetical protein